MSEEIVNRINEFLLGDPNALEAGAKIGLLRSKDISVEQLARHLKITRTSVYKLHQ